ncbi:thiamine/thiamine pyrophosphate ABC transporter permease ThiP [Rhodobacteraceae bacterium W635]|uniref:thiamine/thiamine pyrophosphate ABC transporter permease ThiP n=1 Tax=Nioella halotolerans TaxID=2303578 RepID=UPI000E3D646D|nr:thiamine/thiamine pyrophosphate ABC transporter permease ThiP [Rhodobacteraceae bacterium W635]
MAERAQPLGAAHWAGAGVAALVLLAILGPLGAVLWRAEGLSALGPQDHGAIRFTVWQALLSALFSTALAIPVARALARRRFHGRTALIALMGAPFILPVIVAVLGLIAIFGRQGALNAGLAVFGLQGIEIYGLHGIVLAHVFFNLPLAVRLILQGWLAIPAERFRLAATLGFTSRDIARHMERPMLRQVLPGAFLVIFLICTTSFAVALILGGGPRSTTVELAIYQAFRYDFDLGRAALLGLVQVAICVVAGLLVLRVALPAGMGTGLDRPLERFDAQGGWQRAGDMAVIALSAAFLLLPLGAVFLRGVTGVAGLPGSVWQAAERSVVLSLATAALAVVLALPMALLIARGRAKGLLETIGALSIAVSPLVIGTGLFVILRPHVTPGSSALPVTGLVNALTALPFVLRALVPAVEEAEASHGRLARSLGMGGWARLRHVLLPRIRRPLGFGAGLAAAMAMGDLGVITLFATPQSGTLPLEMFRLMGSYRTDDAEAAALLLLGLSLALFWIFDRGGRVNAAT